jgi:hypothetical protein
LETARQQRVSSLEELSGIVSKSGDTEFTRYGRDSGGEVRLLRCSPATVYRVVALAHDLGFLNESGVLTAAGVSALSDANSFDSALGQSLLRNMKGFGIQISEVNAFIREALIRSAPESLPTLDNIVNFSSTDGAPAKVTRTYFQLLSACGAMRTVRKKLFLPTSKR